MTQKLILILGAAVFLYLFSHLAGDTSIMTNIQSGLIVLCGTVLGAFLAYSPQKLKELLLVLKEVFSKEKVDYLGLVRQIQALALLTRRDGPKALDRVTDQIENVFLRKGIELVADGYDRYDLRNTMEQEFELYVSKREADANMLATLSKLAPVFGFAGTIIGLINILNNIGEPSEIGQGMAVALLTTFYGLLIGNLLFMPLSKKLSEQIRSEAVVFNLIIEGLVDISARKNSKAIGHRLSSYLMMHGLVSSRPAPPKAKRTEEKVVDLPGQKIPVRERHARA